MPIIKRLPESTTFAAPPELSPILMRVRDAIADFSDVKRIDDAELQRHLDYCVLEYSRYRPNVKETTVDLESGTAEYTLDVGDDDVTGIRDVEWSRAPVDGSSLWPDLPRRHEDQAYVDWARSHLDEALDFGWEYRFVDGDHRLRLSPTPSADGTATVVYHCPHVSDSGGVYTTVNKRDEVILEQLCVARCLKAIADDLLMRPSYRTGFVMNEYKNAEALRDGAVAQWKSLINQLSGGL